ncbi:MAG: tetratricopeptide repeat protein [Raineya sp.]|nr:tetratricopeptide repeat protein [Raineya sp.]
MREIIIFLVLSLQVTWVLGQFSQKQKDDLKNLLDYPAVNYTINLNFSVTDYATPLYSCSVLGKLSDEALQQKLQNNYKDAPIYGEMSYRFYKKGNRSEAEKYFNQALPLFAKWQTEEPQNILAYFYEIDYLWSVESYKILESVLQEILQKFPNEKAVYAKNFEFQLFLKNDLQTSQTHLEAFEKQVDANDLHLLNYKKSLGLYTFIMSMRENPEKTLLSDFSFAERAFKANPKSLGHEHFYYYCVTFRSYENLMKRASQKQNSANIKELIKESDKNQIKLLKNAEKFFLKNLSKASESQKVYMLSNLASVYVFLGKFKEAVNYFEQAWQKEKKEDYFEGIIQANGFAGAWDKAEKYLIEALKENPQNLKYLVTLVGLYDRRIPNPELLRKYIAEIEQIGTSNELRSKTLAVWNIKQNNLTRAEFYLDLLGEEDFETLFYKMTLAVLQDKSQEAKSYYEKLVQKDKDDKYLLEAKKILNF